VVTLDDVIVTGNQTVETGGTLSTGN